MTNLPFITVCMPVRNEELFIEKTINELLQQDYPKKRFEIIVADGESTDRTKDIIFRISEKNSNLIWMNNPKKLSSGGRNVCFKNGRGDIFLVVDGHCWIGHNQLFKNIVDCFNKSEAQCLGRPQPLDPPDITDFQKAVALVRASKVGHGGDSLIYSNYEGFVSPTSHGAIYKKEVFGKIGYVDESFDACEDLEFNYRVEKAGFKTFMSPLLSVKYYPRENLLDLFKQMTRYGKGRLEFLKKHPETLSLDGMIPALFICGLIILPMIGICFPFAWHAFILLYGAYTLLIASAAILISKKTKWSYFPKLILIYVVIHFGLGIGFLTKLIG